jgi:hypothetical protein
MHDFRGNEPALEVGVNHAGGGRSLVAFANGPGACLLFAGRQISAQPNKW